MDNKRSLLRPLYLFLGEFSKDAKSIIRDGRSLVLLCIVPILILLTLSLVFGRPLNEKPALAYIGICDLDNSVESIEFAGFFRNVSHVFEYSFGCPDSLVEDVRIGKHTAGIVINKGFSSSLAHGRQAIISVYLDNSNVQVASSAETIIRAVIAQTGEEIGVRFVSTVFGDLLKASGRLDEIIAKIDNATINAKDIDAELSQSKARLESIDTDSFIRTISEANQSISHADAELANASMQLDSIQSRFVEYDQILNSTKSDLATAKEGLTTTHNTILATQAVFGCIQNPLNVPCPSLAPIESQVNAQLIVINTRYSQIEMAQNELAKTNATISEFISKINSSRAGVGIAQSRIDYLFNLADVLATTKGQTLETLSSSQRTIANVVEESQTIRALAIQSKESIRMITERDPRASVVPLSIEPHRFFEGRSYFYVLLPGLVQVITLFIALFITSTRIVREKQNGTLTRLFVSHLSKLEYVLVKVMSFSIIMLLPFILLLVTSASIEPALLDSSSIFFLLVVGALSVITYSALGIIIGWIMDSESSAFLVSLVIGMPLLFLSGMFFPYEFMPPFIGLIGQALPLSVAVQASAKVVLYNLIDPAFAAGVFAYSCILSLLAILCVKFWRVHLA